MVGRHDDGVVVTVWVSPGAGGDAVGAGRRRKRILLEGVPWSIATEVADRLAAGD